MPDQSGGKKKINLIRLSATTPFRILELLVMGGGSVSIDHIIGEEYRDKSKRSIVRLQILQLNNLLGGQEWKYVTGPKSGMGSDGIYHLLFTPVPKKS